MRRPVCRQQGLVVWLVNRSRCRGWSILAIHYSIPLLRLAPDKIPMLGDAVPIDQLNRTPTNVILHVLANGGVQSAFTHQSLAEQILACFAMLRIEVTTEANRELRRAEAEAAHKPRGPIQNLR
jgi:hypothetical protein